MPQVLDYPAIAGKTWEWHLVLFKEWLAQAEEGQSVRKYLKWLRGRKVFDRRFIRFGEYLLGLERGAKLTLNEVGRDLADDLDKSRERQAKAHEQAGKFEAPPTPSADDDPFLRALLERYCELNPYLCMFGFKELAEEFLAPHEIFKRVGTNDFEGRRPTMPQFNGWVQWLEWLGGVKTVGFRCKATKAGTEIAAYLKEMPAEELFADDADIYAGEDELGEPEPASAPAPAPRPPPDDDDDDLLDEEGLDMPPEPEVDEDPDVEPFWKDEARRPSSQLPAEAQPSPSPAATATADPTPPRPATPERVETAPAPTVPASPAPARPLWQSSALARPSAAAVPAWLEQAEPTVSAQVVGLAPQGDPAEFVFRLCVLASLLEVAPAGTAVELYQALEPDLGRFYRGEQGLEPLLEGCARAGGPVACEERLVHAFRYRRGVQGLGALEVAADARALGRLLRDTVTGPSLDAGLAFVIRELAAAKLWSGPGVDVARWLAWSFEPS